MVSCFLGYFLILLSLLFKCEIEACLMSNLPDPVTFILFLKPEWDFSFGIKIVYSLPATVYGSSISQICGSRYSVVN